MTDIIRDGAGDGFRKTPELIALDKRLAQNEADWNRMIQRGDEVAMRAYMEANDKLIAKRRLLVSASRDAAARSRDPWKMP